MTTLAAQLGRACSALEFADLAPDRISLRNSYLVNKFGDQSKHVDRYYQSREANQNVELPDWRHACNTKSHSGDAAQPQQYEETGPHGRDWPLILGKELDGPFQCRDQRSITVRGLQGQDLADLAGQVGDPGRAAPDPGGWLPDVGLVR